MGVYLNPGNDGFQNAVRSKIYVDKTGLLAYTNAVLETEQNHICVSRPRRFGKSMAVEMLVAYYAKNCDSKALFHGLEISKTAGYGKHLNKYDVIRVDMNTLRRKRAARTRRQVSAMEAVDLFHMEILGELREVFGECISEKEVDLPSALARISEVFGNKFIIIIDEWDTIFREDKMDLEAQEAYISLLRGLFKDAPSKKFLKLAYITGILPIKKYGTESALNDFDEFTMTKPSILAEYVGFTETEVDRLCRQYHMDFEEMKRWYDGYSFRKISHIYSPNSVVKAIHYEEFGNYWTSTETYESLKSYISMNFDGLKDAVVAMLSGSRCRVDTGTFENDMVSFASRDDVLTVLIHLGYLAYDAVREEVYIPNEEVCSAFVRAIKKSNWTYVVNAINASEQLLKATWQMDEKSVAEAIENVHIRNSSILKYHDENTLSCVISLAYYNAVNEYTLIREMPTGKGYADIVFLPRKHSEKPAMIVELKYHKSVDGAIAQIKEKKYAAALEEYHGNLLLVGINYDRETKKYDCRIEKMVLE